MKTSRFAGCFVLGSVHSSDAQKPTKIPGVGFLGSASASGERSPSRASAGASAARRSRGKKHRIEYRYADGELGRLPALAAELVNLKVDILVARGAR
jgi:putative tryptophan/tyrosine transport system substrate-binding protein